MGDNNNAKARARDERAWEWLDIHPSTRKLLVQAGLYPTEEKAGERIKRWENELVACVGFVTNLEGRKELLYARFEVDNPQHEYEVTKLILAAGPKAVRRGHNVGKYRPDAEMLFGEIVVYLERERSRKALDRVKDRIKQYDGCPGDVCWVVDTDARIKNIISTCSPPPNHYFTTYRQAIHGWHNPKIWQVNSQ